MEWSGVSLLMAAHSLCPQPCLADEEFFLGLGPWPNIYIDMGSLAFHSHNNILKTMNTKLDLVNVQPIAQV